MLKIVLSIAALALATTACAIQPPMKKVAVKLEPMVSSPRAYVITFRQPMSAEQIEEFRRAFESLARATMSPTARAYTEQPPSGTVTIVIAK